MEEQTHTERRVSALEVLHGFMAGEHDPERSALAMQRRHGALGSFAIDVVMGDVWARPQFSRRDRSLIVISVLAAIGSDEELSLHTNVGLNHGLTRTEIEEILLHVAVYAGFPMAMKASRVVDDRFSARSMGSTDSMNVPPSAFRDDRRATSRCLRCSTHPLPPGAQTRTLTEISVRSLTGSAKSAGSPTNGHSAMCGPETS